MAMTSIIGRSKSYYHTILAMTSNGHDCMKVGFTSTYGSYHGHDCMKVGFTSTYGSRRGQP
jgi:hypothetical protein